MTQEMGAVSRGEAVVAGEEPVPVPEAGAAGAASAPPRRGSDATMVARNRLGNASLPIGRVRRPSRQSFRERFVHTGDPVIVEGALDRWPALERWTPGYFASRWGRVGVSIDGEAFTMAEFVSRVRDPGDTAPYIRAYEVRDLAAGLVGDLEPPLEYMEPNWLDGRFISERFSIRNELRSGKRWELLFGEPGSTFPVLHWDINHYHAYIAQLHGEKSVLIYPPGETEYLYPDEEYPNRSRIPVGRDFDPDRFPEFRKARGASAVLRPGDLLFIPAGWWHAVENTSVSIAVTANTANRANWPAVVRDVTEGRGSALRRRVLSTYLRGVGLLRRALDA